MRTRRVFMCNDKHSLSAFLLSFFSFFFFSLSLLTNFEAKKSKKFRVKKKKERKKRKNMTDTVRPPPSASAMNNNDPIASTAAAAAGPDDVVAVAALIDELKVYTIYFSRFRIAFLFRSNIYKEKCGIFGEKGALSFAAMETFLLFSSPLYLLRVCVLCLRVY